nr:MAG TPA: hypothetical protein [Bacteriophage sp.]
MEVVPPLRNIFYISLYDCKRNFLVILILSVVLLRILYIYLYYRLL